MLEILSFLERVGIPAGFAYVLLFRIEPRLEALTKAVLELPTHMHTCAYSTAPIHQPIEQRP